MLTALAQACRDTERLEFGYTARSGERTDRHVEPLEFEHVHPTQRSYK